MQGCTCELGTEEGVVKNLALPPKSLAFASVFGSISSVFICLGALVHTVWSTN